MKENPTLKSVAQILIDAFDVDIQLFQRRAISSLDATQTGKALAMWAKDNPVVFGVLLRSASVLIKRIPKGNNLIVNTLINQLDRLPADIHQTISDHQRPAGAFVVQSSGCCGWEDFELEAEFVEGISRDYFAFITYFVVISEILKEFEGEFSQPFKIDQDLFVRRIKDTSKVRTLELTNGPMPQYWVDSFRSIAKQLQDDVNENCMSPSNKVLSELTASELDQFSAWNQTIVRRAKDQVPSELVELQQDISKLEHLLLKWMQEQRSESYTKILLDFIHCIKTSSTKNKRGSNGC